MRRKTLRRRNLKNAKYSKTRRVTLKHKRKHKRYKQRGGSPQNKSPSYLAKFYSSIKERLGVTSHTVSLNKLIKSVLADIPKDQQDQFIVNLKANLKSMIKELGLKPSEPENPENPDSSLNEEPDNKPEFPHLPDDDHDNKESHDSSENKALNPSSQNLPPSLETPSLESPTEPSSPKSPTENPLV